MLSNKIIAIGVVLFIVFFLLVRYILINTELLDKANADLSDNQILIVSLIMSIILAIISVLGYKQYLIFRGSRIHLLEDF